VIFKNELKKKSFMPEEILLENLNLISESIDVITRRFFEINAPDDLVSSE